MPKAFFVAAIALMIAGFAAPRPASAALICTIEGGIAHSSNHKTKVGAKTRAWVNWQGEMRNKHGRRFSRALARIIPGPHKWLNKKRFHYAFQVAARGCYRKGVTCGTSTTSDTVLGGCECMPEAQARQNGCRVYREAR